LLTWFNDGPTIVVVVSPERIAKRHWRSHNWYRLKSKLKTCFYNKYILSRYCT
jgi:hypothetical protein